MGWYWAAWIVILFGVPETVALATGHGEWTLSENVWKWFDVLPGQTIHQWKFLHFVLAAFMVWLTAHFVLGIFR